MRLTASLFCVVLAACGSAAVSSGGAAPAPVADDGRIETHGLTLQIPNGWTAQAAEPIAGWPTVVSVSSNAHGKSLALLEIVRRSESDPDIKRRPAAHHVTELVLAWSGAFAGIDVSDGPQEAALAGKSATLIRAELTTEAVDGTEVVLSARFYGFKAAAAAWVVRAIGPADGSADPDLDAMLASMRVNE